MLRISLIHRIIGVIVMMFVGVGLLSVVYAQNDPAAITITGTVEAVNTTTIVVSGATVDFSQVDVTNLDIQAGLVVQVTGTFDNGVIVAAVIVIINPTTTPEATAEQTPEVTETPAPENTAEATVSPESTPEITLTPSPTNPDDTVIIIEGPVQQINVNIITIFNINIQVEANDPILTQVKIGDNLHVEGYAHPEGNTIIIIAINITIVNVIIINPPPQPAQLPGNCKITPKGHIKCTKKH